MKRKGRTLNRSAECELPSARPPSELQLTITRPSVADMHMALFTAGQLINLVRFHITQAWLLDCAEQIGLASAAYDDLALIVRDFPVSDDARERLSAQIKQRKQGWEAWVRSGEHGEFLAMLESQTGKNANAFEDARSEAELNGLTSKNVLKELLEGVLDQFMNGVFRLGEFVDKGLHPPTIIDEVVANQRRRHDQIGPAQNPFAIGAEPSERAFYLSINCTSRHPEPSWFQELSKHWGELGLSTEPMSEFDTTGEVDHLPPVEELFNAIVATTATAIRSRVTKAVDEMEPTNALGKKAESRFEVFITFGEGHLAFKGPDGTSFNLTPDEERNFEPFLQKVRAGQPSEIVLSESLNGLFGDDSKKQHSVRARSFFSKFNARLKAWQPAPDGHNWIRTRKKIGRFLNPKICWTLDKTNSTIRDLIRENKSARSYHVDPHTMDRHSE